MSTKLNFERLTFRLDPEIAAKFSEAADASGLTKAAYLRRLVLQTRKLDFDFYSNSPLECSFNLRVEPHTLNRLLDLADLYRIRLSECVRIILTNNLVKVIDQESLRSSAPMDLDFSELMTVTKIELSLGKLEKSAELVSEMEKRVNSANLQDRRLAEVWSFKGSLLRRQRSFRAAKAYLHQGLKIANANSVKSLRIPMMAELGVIAGIEEDYDKAWSISEEMAAMQDCETGLLSKVKSMMRAANLLSLRGDSPAARIILYKALGLVDQLSTETQRCFIQTRAANVFAREGEVEIARNLLLSGLETTHLAGSVSELHYMYENLGLLALVSGDLIAAENYFAISGNFQQQFFGESALSKLKLWQLFLLAKSNYASARRQLSDLQWSSVEMPYPQLTQYISYAIDYVFAPQVQVRTNAERKLRQLAHSARYAHLSSAAAETLSKKWLAVAV